MNVSLTPELETLVQEKVKTGMYHSASEVVRAGLRLLQEQDAVYALRLEELRREIQIGIDAADQGELVEFDPAAIMRQVHERLAAAK